MAGDGAVTWQRALCPAGGDELGSDLRADADPQAGSARRTGSRRAGRPRRRRGPCASRSALARRDAGSGTEASSSCVYGWSGACEHALGRPLLDDLAGVHHEHRVGDVARAREVVRDVEEREALALLQVEHQVQDPDADRDVEHRRRLVGDRARVGSTASARAIATRCRWPPESSCGYFVDVLSAGTSPTVSSSSCRRASMPSRDTLPWIFSGRARW